MTFKILFVGDIIGNPARQAVQKVLPGLRKEYGVDYVIANGENSAHGFGITTRVYNDLLETGIDLITGGNHIWDKKEVFQEIDQMIKLLRPLNYPACPYGNGYLIENINGVRVCTINLLGRVFVDWNLDDPFRATDKLLEEIKGKTDIIIVDIHAETTSEKKALGFYLDGRVSAVLGTHTHVQTADERILPNGTGYQSDVGMVGVKNSVLGMETKTALTRFLTGLKERFEVEKAGEIEFNACLVEIDPKTGKTVKIERIYREVANG